MKGKERTNERPRKEMGKRDAPPQKKKEKEREIRKIKQIVTHNIHTLYRFSRMKAQLLKMENNLTRKHHFLLIEIHHEIHSTDKKSLFYCSYLM